MHRGRSPHTTQKKLASLPFFLTLLTIFHHNNIWSLIHLFCPVFCLILDSIMYNVHVVACSLLFWVHFNSVFDTFYVFCSTFYVGLDYQKHIEYSLCTLEFQSFFLAKKTHKNHAENSKFSNMTRKLSTLIIAERDSVFSLKPEARSRNLSALIRKMQEIFFYY